MLLVYSCRKAAVCSGQNLNFRCTQRKPYGILNCCPLGHFCLLLFVGSGASYFIWIFIWEIGESLTCLARLSLKSLTQVWHIVPSLSPVSYVQGPVPSVLTEGLWRAVPRCQGLDNFLTLCWDSTCPPPSSLSSCLSFKGFSSWGGTNHIFQQFNFISWFSPFFKA